MRSKIGLFTVLHVLPAGLLHNLFSQREWGRIKVSKHFVMNLKKGGLQQVE